MHTDSDRRPRFREAIRVRHYSPRTEKTYWYWICYLIRFHKLRHPAAISEPEVSTFLTWLATKRGVAAAPQNQTSNALVFLYRHVIKAPLGEIQNYRIRVRPSLLPLNRSAQAWKSQTQDLTPSLLHKPICSVHALNICSVEAAMLRSTAS
ncbi:integrase (plasmid) [Alcanivorax sp. N3-2A]|nr:integrase [Alcanivorax sp. N3-2A]ASK36697.1 integrase [Alcanivorax sp. N3-2A]